MQDYQSRLDAYKHLVSSRHVTLYLAGTPVNLRAGDSSPQHTSKQPGRQGRRDQRFARSPLPPTPDSAVAPVDSVALPRSGSPRLRSSEPQAGASNQRPASPAPPG